jgi:HSP20 family protein
MSETNRVAAQDTQQGRTSAPPQGALFPPVDIVENENGILLVADLPGVSKDRLDVRVDGESLVIEGTASVPVTDGFELTHQEVRHPAYRRSFTLSRELDASKIEAGLKDGVLTLHIPKAEEARPRRIDVKVG